MKKRIFALAVTVIMILSLAVSASAADYKSFELSEDLSELTDNEGNVYEKIELPDGFFADSHYSYQYNYSVEVPRDSNSTFSAQICSLAKNYDLLRIEWYDYENDADIMVYYAGEKAKSDIESFFAGSSDLFKLRSNSSKNYYAKIDASLVRLIDEYVKETPDSTESFDVSKLKKSENLTLSFTLLSYSKDYVVAREYGGLYQIGDDWYYLGFEDLENNYFDANGYFSYRKGSASLTKLDENLGAKLSAAADPTERWDQIYENEYRYIEDDLFGFGYYGDSVAAKVFFWLNFAFIGFVVPAVPLIFGLILPNMKKRTHTKKWYAVACISLVWIISALVIMLILII